MKGQGYIVVRNQSALKYSISPFFSLTIRVTDSRGSFTDGVVTLRTYRSLNGAKTGTINPVGFVLLTEECVVETNDALHLKYGIVSRHPVSYTFRLFNVSGELTLEYMSLSGGRADGDGGLVFVSQSGVLSLFRSLLRRGHATQGGGIYTATGSTVSIRQSTLSGNTASGDGGALFAYCETTVHLMKTTLTGMPLPMVVA